MKEIRQIIEFYDRYKEYEYKMALASVVVIEESSYRRIGARMLVCENGEWTGGISGGCLEGDALRRSQKAIYKGECSTVVYDTMEDDQNEIGVGLGCNGRIEVLFCPIDVTDEYNEIEQLRSIVKKNEPAVLIKIIEAAEQSDLGKVSILADRSSSQLFAGVKEDKIREAISEMRINRRPQILRFTHDGNQYIDILAEYLRPETRLLIIGDNYDVMSMVGIAQELGWQIHIVGRQRKISKSIIAKCKSIHEYEKIDQVAIDEFTAVVLMTHDYNWDKKLLPYIISKKPSYVGMLGPKKRVEKMDQEIENIALCELEYFHSPVGLDIGAESPEEIALSIAAEIIAVMRDRKGQKLKNRKEAIHHRKTRVHVIG